MSDSKVRDIQLRAEDARGLANEISVLGPVRERRLADAIIKLVEALEIAAGEIQDLRQQVITLKGYRK